MNTYNTPYMDIYTQTNTHVRTTHSHMHIHTQTDPCTDRDTDTQTHTWTHRHTHGHTHTDTHRHTHTHTHTYLPYTSHHPPQRVACISYTWHIWYGNGSLQPIVLPTTYCNVHIPWLLNVIVTDTMCYQLQLNILLTRILNHRNHTCYLNCQPHECTIEY